MRKSYLILLSVLLLVGCNNKQNIESPSIVDSSSGNEVPSDSYLSTEDSVSSEIVSSSLVHEHNLDEKYYKDKNEHWFVCNDCLERVNVESHVFDDEGFCKCGKSLIDLEYSFNDDRRGFAGGKVTLSGIRFPSVYSYSLFWSNKYGVISTTEFAYSLGNNKEVLEIKIEDHITIPNEATKISLIVNDTDLFGVYDIDTNKIINNETKIKFASVSDVHTNYNQGDKYWTNALNEYEKKGVSYVVISGDIGESDDDYYKYELSTKNSDFKGLIFASLGNHDQTAAGRKNFRSHVCYDGIAKQFISLDNLSLYFKRNYQGNLNVNIEYVGGNDTYYYNAIINDNLFIFMDQMLRSTANTSQQDNFSTEQLIFVEESLYKYSESHNLFIVEHAPITQFKIGDRYNNGYGNSLLLPYSYKNNRRFALLLEEYTEAIWLSGHTHVQFDTAICYLNKYYDAKGNLTDKKMAHMVHNSSVAQARFYTGEGMIYKNDFSAGSEGYICVQDQDSVEFLACRFKEYTPNSIDYDPSLFEFTYLHKNSFRIPLETKSHKYPLDDELIYDVDTPKVNLATIDNFYIRRGTPTAKETDEGLKLVFSDVSDRIEIKAGNQEDAWYNGYYLQFVVKTNITTFNVGGSNYSGGRYTIVTVNMNSSSSNYTIKDLNDGYKLVQIPFILVGNEITNHEIAIRFYDPNIAGYMILKELFINKKES